MLGVHGDKGDGRKKLLTWAAWFFRKTKDTCGLCKRTQADFKDTEKCGGIETVRICPTGKVPKLTPNNRKFQELFFRILPGLCDGFGGFSFFGVDYVCRIFGVTPGEMPIVHDKILVIIACIEDARKQK